MHLTIKDAELALATLSFVAEFVALVGLLWYCLETVRLRKATEAQVNVSQKIMIAANDQMEGTAKPCLIVLAKPRDRSAAVMNAHSIYGNMEACEDADGCYLLQNIGNGVALNIRYSIPYALLKHPLDPAAEASLRPQCEHRIPYVAPSEEVSLVETREVYKSHHIAIFDYESIGGRKYRSTIELKERVLTDFQFIELSSPS